MTKCYRAGCFQFLQLLFRVCAAACSYMSRTERMAATVPTEIVNVLRKEVVLVSRPQGLLTEGNIKVIESDFTYTKPLHDENSLLLKIIYISLDPYMRIIMNEDSGLHGIPALELGKPIWASNLSKVLASSNSEFKEGDVVLSIAPVTNYAILPVKSGSMLRKIDNAGVDMPLAHYLGILGMSGNTAWVGLNIITQLQSKEEIFISAAAGSVGLIAGQLAKLKGCRVVGSTGNDEKVKRLKDVYEFDDAFNYKTEDCSSSLKKCFPNGVDLYFDNVGGHMLEAALENMKTKARILACGMISQYNEEHIERYAVRNLMRIVGKSLRVEGFLISDYHDTWDAFFKEIGQYIREGKIKYDTTVLGRGIEEFSQALVRMFRGENMGKSVLFVSNE